MKVHFEPIELIGRLYYNEGSYEERTPFDTVFTVSILNNKNAYLRAAKGEITLEAYKEIAKKLITEYNLNTVQMERHGKTITLDLHRIAK